MADEFKSYDSQDRYSIHNARLTKDAEVRDGTKGPMVRLTFVSTCRGERHSDLWIEATVSDFNSAMAAHLKKGDVIGIAGKPGLRRYGDDNEKFSFELLRADIYPSIPLIQALKERGFTPGQAATTKKAAPKKATVAKKTVVEIPDDDDSDGDE